MERLHSLVAQTARNVLHPGKCLLEVLHHEVEKDKKNIKLSHQDSSKIHSSLPEIYIQKLGKISGLMCKSGYNGSFVASVACISYQLLFISNERFISLFYMRIASGYTEIGCKK